MGKCVTPARSRVEVHTFFKAVMYGFVALLLEVGNK